MRFPTATRVTPTKDRLVLTSTHVGMQTGQTLLQPAIDCQSLGVLLVLHGKHRFLRLVAGVAWMGIAASNREPPRIADLPCGWDSFLDRSPSWRRGCRVRPRGGPARSGAHAAVRPSRVLVLRQKTHQKDVAAVERGGCQPWNAWLTWSPAYRLLV